jgi:hypothetical protein
MREILFRGQTRRLGEKVRMNGEKVPSNWVYGGICQGKGDFSIIYGSMDMKLEQPTEKRVVYTDTIGQYTGLTDKNGTKIFEGDIVKVTLVDGEEIGLIGWSDIGSSFKFASPDGTAYGIDVTDIFEIIGNIYDNPELLRGDHNE